ncbi:MAG: hypothetical protein A3H96_19880 [Acidobacteria bacterium RIFCSPLOWO2_02_FULL_67_36]|nr:MAG: hypothetical protein A3H96_19880 [Acidobacteria bacterium RIFCSPLOWO2_02_FULL_67_36]OFW23304.1 MAG: hypothetical protein A3G21_10385 [Acidobacteria bacterium RIFCSPLOWO2_12_FULL_66_21]
MDQRLRLVQGNIGRSEKRAADRQPISVRGQIVWKDARGSTQVTSVITRDASERGVTVECEGGRAIPLYRLVYFQVDRDSRRRPDLPAPLRNPSVLSAVFRVGPYSEATGSPAEYGLRLLVEPQPVSASGWTARLGKMATA